MKAGARLQELWGNQKLHPEQQHRQVLRHNASVDHRSWKSPAARDHSSPRRSRQHPLHDALIDLYPSCRAKPARAELQSRSIGPELAVSHPNNTSFRFSCVWRASIRTRAPDRPQIMEISSNESRIRGQSKSLTLTPVRSAKRYQPCLLPILISVSETEPAPPVRWGQVRGTRPRLYCCNSLQ